MPWGKEVGVPQELHGPPHPVLLNRMENCAPTEVDGLDPWDLLQTLSLLRLNRINNPSRRISVRRIAILREWVEVRARYFLPVQKSLISVE